MRARRLRRWLARVLINRGAAAVRGYPRDELRAIDTRAWVAVVFVIDALSRGDKVQIERIRGVTEDTIYLETETIMLGDGPQMMRR